MSSRRLAVLLLALLALLGPAHSLLEKLEIDSDARTNFLISSFGYEAGGNFRLVLSDFQLLVPAGYAALNDPEHAYKIAFVLERSELEGGQERERVGCLHRLYENGPDWQVISLASRLNWQHLTVQHQITKPGYYLLHFSNCEPDTEVSFSLELEQYNVDPYTHKPSYLSAGEASLPTWYMWFTLFFAIEAGIWFYALWKHRETAKIIHILMGVVVILKVLSLLFETLRYRGLKAHGTHDAFFVLYEIFTFARGMLMFGVIVLIGTGWSYLKPFLTERDKTILLVTLVVQLMANIAMVVVDDEQRGTASWVTWKDMLHVLDIVCCLVILLPIVWSIRHLRQAVAEDVKDGRAARTLSRLQSFRRFYLLVVAYIYFTRIIVYLLSEALSMEWAWVAPVVNEVAHLVFYAMTGWLFRPQVRNPYLPLEQNEDDETAAAAAVELAL